MESNTEPGLAEMLAEGDIVEVTVSGVRRTAEVMLLSEGMALLDFFDGDRPVIAPITRLVDIEIFRPDNDLAAA